MPVSGTITAQCAICHKIARHKNFLDCAHRMERHFPSNDILHQKSQNILFQCFDSVLTGIVRRKKTILFQFNKTHYNKSQEDDGGRRRTRQYILDDCMMKSILRICKRLHPPCNRRKRRKKWFNLRLEEAENKIYRLPPPGNGNQKQTAITDFFSRIRVEDQIDELENAAQLQTEDTEPQREPNHQTNQPELRILQWNACSMNEEKETIRVSDKRKQNRCHMRI